MKTTLGLLALAAVSCALSRPAAAEPPQVEIGAFIHDLHSGGDWRGQRVLVRTKGGQDLVVQVEGVHEERGREEGRLLSGACWADLTPRAYLFGSVAAGAGDAFMLRGRADLEVHVKLGAAKRTVLGAGLGRVRFEADDVTLGSVAVSRWFERAVLSWRYIRVESDPRKPGASAREGDTHLVSLMAGKEDDRSGRFDLLLLSGVDVARDVALGGAALRTDARVASLAWRKLWTEHFGTHVAVEWGSWEDSDTRRGAEVRVVLK